MTEQTSKRPWPSRDQQNIPPAREFLEALSESAKSIAQAINQQLKRQAGRPSGGFTQERGRNPRNTENQAREVTAGPRRKK